jgi:integrase
MRRRKEEEWNIAALEIPPGKSEAFYWHPHLPGFGVRLRGKTRRWYVQYRVGAQQRRESLGDVRRVNLKDAREIARQRFASIELGTDPAAEKAKARAEAAAVKLTMAEVAKRYLKFKVDAVRDRTYSQTKMHLERYFKTLENKPISAIKRADVAAALQDIVADHGRVAAARARSNLSSMFSWAMREGLCEANPVINTNDPAEGIDSRDRILTDQELAAVWQACSEDDFGRIVKLLVLTGCRREEIGGLRWSEIDLETGVMTIPGERTKNHKTHILTLPATAIEILKSAPRRGNRDVIFGGGKTGFNAWSYAMAAMHVRITTAEGRVLPHWVLHDLRRSFRSGLGRLGVRPDVAERAVNHIKGGVEAVYDRYRYQDEIKAALALWAEHVRLLVT